MLPVRINGKLWTLRTHGTSLSLTVCPMDGSLLIHITGDYYCEDEFLHSNRISSISESSSEDFLLADCPQECEESGSSMPCVTLSNSRVEHSR